MKRRLGRYLVILGVAGLSLVPAAASADTISRSEIITVTATVAPARDIIVDSTGAIQQIISNNSLADVTPQVFTSSVSVANETPLTPDIAEQYSMLMRGRVIKPGIIYQRPPIVASPKPLKQRYFSFTSIALPNLDHNESVAHRLS